AGTAGSYQIAFRGNLASANQAQLIVDNTSMLGGSLLAVTVADGGLTTGSEIQVVTIVPPLGQTITGGYFTLPYNGQITAPLAFNATNTAVQSALQALGTVGAGNVTVTGQSGANGGTYYLRFGGNLAGRDVGLATLTATNLTLTSGTAVATV